MLRRISETPLSSDRTSVGCLTRGTALPYTVAVSGYTSGIFGTRDGALDRLLWLERVFQLAGLIDHSLPANSYDEPSHPGSSNACHVEKQLLAYVVWVHSAALGDEDERESLSVYEAPSPSRLPLEVFVH